MQLAHPRRPTAALHLTVLTVLLCVGLTAAAQDTTPPLVSVTYPASGAIITSDLDHISGTASDPESGILAVRFQLWRLADECVPGPSGSMCYQIWRTTPLGGTEWFYSDELDYIDQPTDNGSPNWVSTFNLPLMEDMQDGVEYFILAQANNAGSPQLLSRAFSSYIFHSPDGDVTPPVIGTIYSVAGRFPSVAAGDPTDDGLTAIRLGVSDNNSGVAGVRWSAVDQAYAAMANTCTLGPPGEATCVATLTGIGLHTVYLRAIDVAGNETPSATVVPYWIDVTPPSAITVTSVAGDSSPPYLDPTDDRWTNVAYTVSDSTSLIAGVRVSETNVPYSSMLYNCTPGASCALSFYGAGSHTVYMRAIDAAGNESPTTTLTYVIDGTPPSNVAVSSVAGDASAPYVDPTDDGSTALALSVSDVGTGVAGVRWGLADAVYGSLPNACASTSTCTIGLTGAGPKTIYLRAIDGAGNTSISATRLDYSVASPPPVAASITIATPANGSALTLAPTSVGGTVSNATAVTFTYRDLTAGTYWNGTGWQAASRGLGATISGGSWASSAALPTKLTTQRQYRISATATGATNATATTTFTFSSRIRGARP